MRDKMFSLFHTLATRYTGWTIGFAVLLMVVGMGLSAGLRMEMRVLDLVPDDEPSAQEYNTIIEQFSSASQIMVGVEGGSRADKIAFLDELKLQATDAVCVTTSGETKKYIKRAVVKSDLEFIERHGLMMSKASDLENTEELFADLSLAPLLTAHNDFFEREYIEDSGSVTEREKEDRAISGLKNIIIWLEGIELYDNGPEAMLKHATKASDLLTVGDPYMFSDDDSMALAMLTPSIAFDDLNGVISGVRSLREIIVGIQGSYPDLQVRMAGMPVLAVEESEVGMEDMGLSTLISLVLVLGLFIVAFRMWTAPMLAMINLIIGIGWTSGLLALLFGRLNLFTAFFAVILLGLGIDFAIHLNAAFSTARSKGLSLEEAVREMYTVAGRGVLTGGFTTAAAFLALAFTGLDAFVELGVVLGGGILLTLLSSLVVLPALYAMHVRMGSWFRRKLKREEPKPRSVSLAMPFLGRVGDFISARPWTVVALCALLTAGAVHQARQAEFDRDMLNIEPQDMPSVTLHRDILRKFEIQPDFAMVTVKDLDEARPIVKKMKKNRLVGRVDAISEFVPSEKEQKRRRKIVRRIGEKMREQLDPSLVLGMPAGAAALDPEKLADLDEAAEKDVVSEEQIKTILAELDRLQLNVQEVGQLAFASMKNRLHGTCERLSGGEDEKFSKILLLKNRLAERKNLAAAVTAYQDLYKPLLAKKLHAMADTTPITVEMLPEEIRDRYLSEEGRNLITIYPSVDLWQGDKADLFISAASKTSERVTGTVVLVDKLIELIAEKGLLAIWLALGTVFLLLLIDFRHLGYALLGMVPLLVGCTWMIALFVMFERKFDVANVEAVLLILGIGIDDAVHVLHAVRREGVRNMGNILRHTGRALVLTSLTTGIAFGSIAFAQHVGLAGMGLLLVLGVTTCLAASIFLMPALLRIFLKDQTSDKETASKADSENKEAEHVPA